MQRRSADYHGSTSPLSDRGVYIPQDWEYDPCRGCKSWGGETDERPSHDLADHQRCLPDGVNHRCLRYDLRDRCKRYNKRNVCLEWDHTERFNYECWTVTQATYDAVPHTLVNCYEHAPASMRLRVYPRLRTHAPVRGPRGLPGDRVALRAATCSTSTALR